MRITNVSYYEGKFKGSDQSFQIMVEDDDRYVVYRLSPGDTLEEGIFPKTDLGHPEVFPQAIGKFVPELVSLEKPIPIDQIPTYQVAEQLLKDYFRAYAVTFS
jgi:hypothetical protein